MSVFIAINKMLDTQLGSMLGVPPVAWTNRDFTPVEGTLYLRPTLIAGDTFQSTLGANGQDTSVGIYQVDIFSKAGSGRKENLLMADLIASRFKRGTYLSADGHALRIKNVSRRVATNDTNGWFMLPIEITYIAITEARV